MGQDGIKLELRFQNPWGVCNLYFYGEIFYENFVHNMVHAAH